LPGTHLYNVYTLTMAYQLLTDEILLKLLKTSDEEAFREIYVRYWRTLFATAYRKVHVKEVAEELVQNIFLSLWEKKSTVTIEQLSAYLNTAVKYQVLNYIKTCIVKEKYAHLVKAKPELLEEDGDSMLVMHELSDAIDRAINQLPEKSRVIFQLSRFENRSIKEIADLLSVSEKVVEYHITKSLKALRLELKDFIVVELILMNLHHFR
jgi:RNA polymerase sigma-70 factor (family 1)